ncbi:MAG: restriction endonuclease [Planctomycetota bacterium]|nr:MAG: restriction endonuclease [Planctomycetota bacterium]
MSGFSPAPGKVTAADIEQAQYRVAALKPRAVQLRNSVRRASRQVRLLSLQLSLLKKVLGWRHAFDANLGRVGLCCIAMTAGAGIFVIGAHSIAPGPRGHLMAIAAGLIVTGAVLLPIVFYPSDTRLRSLEAAGAARLPEIVSTRESLRLELAQQEQRLAHAQAELDQLEAVAKGARHKLHSAPWPSMQGTEFELFLADVFRGCGYDVTLTGKSGDQGVDLIVSRGGIQVAVQAKGYPASSVGNSAVQEAHAGMAHYRCHAAAVVTNSRFTSSARELATSVRCILIDGSQIPDVIDGRVSLIPTQ